MKIKLNDIRPDRGIANSMAEALDMYKIRYDASTLLQDKEMTMTGTKNMKSDSNSMECLKCK
eukprot:CAMPEP_0114235394 /NCGR_PEP_ID=MMETSP0058-20121206/6227_1 /TAXON_ID=36894 /ORGANISM="Pyramimonas parkeae, CCMP726" /LENGTH=61 /DNA_ID=CAMNT_0001347153 /DNA_START=512 /DNA_END=697 /DNA_ORIENTATION=-